MDAIIQVLYGIPILGLVFQFIGYLVDVLPNISPIIMREATPIALAALCGVMCERSGVVNIGIEGIMIATAFVGWYVGVLVAPLFPSDPSVFFGITPALVIALGAALLTGLIISALHAWLSISVRADQIISGTIINIAAFGLTGYLNTLISQTSPNGAGAFSRFVPPKEITEIPLIGWVINMFLRQGPITMSVLVIIIVFQVLLFRSRWGLRSRAAGEHPRAAETVGINVIWLRYRNVIFAGAFAALAGAYLSMEGTNSFQTGMTNGRGFIGLAAMIVGRWTPVGAFGAALLFASSRALGISINGNPPTGQLGDLLGSVPGQVFDALPYLVTIIVLAGLIGRSVAPAADGLPYEREATT
jgi:simple sugar transport system permease protein